MSTPAINSILDTLIAAGCWLTVPQIAERTGMLYERTRAQLAALAAAESINRRQSAATPQAIEYSISAAQAKRAIRSRVEATPPVAAIQPPRPPVGVAILSDPLRLAGRLIYLERLLARPVFAGDATLTAIAGDYRATLAAVHAIEDSQPDGEVPA